MAGAPAIDRKELILIIKSAVLSRPSMVTASSLEKECKQECNGKLNMRQLGFNTFVDFLKSIPTVVQLIPTNGYDLEVRPVLSEKSRHIDELVQRQRVQPSRRRGTGRRLCRRRTALAPPPTAHRPNQGSTYRNTNYDQKDHSRNGYHNSNDRADRMVDQRGDSVYPRLSDSSISFNNTREVKYIPAETLDDFDEEYEDEFEDDSEEELFHQVEEQYKDLHCNGKIGSLSQSPLQSEEVSAVGDTAVVSSKDKDFDRNAYTPEDDCTSISTKMMNNFRQILNQYPEGIWATELQNLYQNQYGVQFNLHDLGFNNVISLVAALPSVFSYRREGTHDWKLYDARYVTQESLEAKGEIVFPESEIYIPQTIIDNIKKMLKAHNGGFRSTELLDLYLETYNKPLKLEVLGLSMDEFVNLLRNDVTVMEFKNYYVLLPKHERLPCEAIEPATPDERLKLPGGTLNVPIPDAVLKLGEVILAQDMPPIQQSGDDPLWELEVRVAEVMSPVYFYMILGSTFEEMENMMDDLEKFYQLEEESLKIPPPYIAENLYCVAKYLDHWHRVKIVKVNSYDMIEIEYIDYGTPGKINCLELRYLSTNFAKFPAQAICAKLIGVKPRNGMTKFPDEVCKKFLRIVSEKRLVAHVYQVTEKVRHKKERVQMEVILFDVENPEGELVINDYLINCGLASPIPTETETEDSPDGDLLPDGNILLESDPPQITGDIPLENYFLQVNGVLPPLLPSGSTSLLGDVASPLGNSSALLPASSKTQERKAVCPPPGFKLKDSNDPNMDFSSPPFASPTQSSEPQPVDCLLSGVWVNGYTCNPPQRSPPSPSLPPIPPTIAQPPNPSIPNPFMGSHLYQRQSTNPHILYPLFPPSNVYQPQYHSVPVNSVVLPSVNYYQPIQNMENGFANIQGYGNKPFCSQFPVPSITFQPLPTPPHPILIQAIPSPPPSNITTTSRPSASPTLTPSHSFTCLTPSPTLSGHSSSATNFYSPITIPECPPRKNIQTYSTTTIKTVPSSQHTFPVSPIKFELTEANHIPRPATPLTPASAEVANICNLNRLDALAFQVSKHLYSTPHNNISNGLLDSENVLKSSNNVQTEKSQLIPKTDSNSPVGFNFNPPLQADNIKIQCPTDKNISYNQSSSAMSSSLDSLYCPSPLKEDSSDDYMSASENLEGVQNSLSCLTMTEQQPNQTLDFPSEPKDDILCSWDDLDIDDTPVKASDLPQDIDEQIKLYLKSLKEPTNVRVNSVDLSQHSPLSVEIFNEPTNVRVDSVDLSQHSPLSVEICNEPTNVQVDSVDLSQHSPEIFNEPTNATINSEDLIPHSPLSVESFNEPTNVRVDSVDFSSHSPMLVESLNEPTNATINSADLSLHSPLSVESFNKPTNVRLDLVDFSSHSPTLVESLNEPTNATINSEDLSQHSPLLKIDQVPINWKDNFDPDALSISRRVDNNNLQTKSPFSIKEIKKIPIQIVEIQNKHFHLLLVDNKWSVIAMEFLSQFTSGKPTTTVKVIELNSSISLFDVTQTSHPSILAELNKLSGFFGGIDNKKTVIKMNKVLMLYLKDIPACLRQIQFTNEAVYNDFKKIADELS